MDGHEFVLAILFLTVVVPVWLSYHYRAKQRARHALSDQEQQDLSDLQRLAARLESRVQTLERILDADAPGWRRKVSEG